MKVVFLDFDGVILTLRGAISEGVSWARSEPDPLVCRAIARACNAGVRIVVSSTWRTFGESCWEKLVPHGLKAFLHEDWRTIEVQWREPGDCRPREIAEWLARHPEVTDYRILDDDGFQWTKEQDARWIQCHPEDGMPARGMIELIEWSGAPLRYSTAWEAV